MRAVYFSNAKDFAKGDIIKYAEDGFHHLKNVIRLKENENLILMDGKGSSVSTRVLEVAKKYFLLEVESLKFVEKSNRRCAISKLKKDSLELSIKSAIELGVNKIYVVQTEFSQNYKLNFDRLGKIAISAMIQSNNPYLCEFMEIPSTSSIVQELKDELLVFDMIKSECQLAKDSQKVVFIGPEGGFSPGERRLFLENGVYLHYFQTPILRAETALVAALTYSYL